MFWKILIAVFITLVINETNKEHQRYGWVYVPKMDSVYVQGIKLDTVNQK